MEKLAIDGGPKTKTNAFASARRYGEEEMAELRQAIDQDNLFYRTPGGKTEQFIEKVKAYFGAKFCATCSSGTGGLHGAVGSLEIEPGYEVITSPITDYGSLIGLLFQNLIPVFADVDPNTYNITAETIAAKITDRTRAIIAVHLAGNPCEMDEILALGKKRGIPVIEDVAQSYNAIYKGRKAGTMGDMGCFSLNGFKHISAGDGGFVLTENEALYKQLHNYLDKFYNRLNQGVTMSRLATCYRITETQSAVAIAQLAKLDRITTTRNRYGDRLTAIIGEAPGALPHKVHAHNKSSYWFYMLRVDPNALTVDRNRFAEALRAEGIPADAGYIEKPVYMTPVFANKSFFPGNIWPAEIVSGRKYAYREGMCPVAEEVLRTAIRLPLKEWFSAEDIEEMGQAIVKVASAYAKR